MTTEKMTVHQALCELKVSDKRITDAIAASKFVVEKKNSSTQVDGIPVKDFNDIAQASWQRINDLINRVNAIKKALSKSNAETLVTVSGKEMSVAEAIYLQQYGISFKATFLNVLRVQYSNAINRVNVENGDKLEQRLDRYIAENYGGKDKTNSEVIEEASKKFREQNTFALVDPLKILDKIAALEEDIAKFQAEVDAALQMSNATTFITIEY